MGDLGVVDVVVEEVDLQVGTMEEDLQVMDMVAGCRGRGCGSGGASGGSYGGGGLFGGAHGSGGSSGGGYGSSSGSGCGGRGCGSIGSSGGNYGGGSSGGSHGSGGSGCGRGGCGSSSGGNGYGSSSGNEFYLLDWLNSHPEIRTKSALPNDVEDTGDFIVHQNKQNEDKNEKSKKQDDSINFKD